jgi:predicted RND superfamily exporter protein
MDSDKYNINENDVIAYSKEKNLEYTSLTTEEKKKIKKEILSQLVSQYLVLYSGNMDEMIAQDQIKPKMAKLTITLKETNGNELKRIKKDIIEYTKNHIPKNYHIEIGGTAMLGNELNDVVVFGQISSFFISILIIFIIVTISFKSFSAGFISVIPLTISIITNFAIMGFFHLELNIATALIASLTTGMGIDYAIHLLTFYKNNMKIYNDVDKAIEMTFLTSGKAIIYNALSVGLGFGVLLFSSLIILGTFGILITLTMLTSAFGALTIIPILLEIFKPKFAEK